MCTSEPNSQLQKKLYQHYTSFPASEKVFHRTLVYTEYYQLIRLLLILVKMVCYYFSLDFSHYCKGQPSFQVFINYS